MAAIRKVAPEMRFESLEWGTIDGEDYSIEVNIGADDPVMGFAFHLRGGMVGCSWSPRFWPSWTFAPLRLEPALVYSTWTRQARPSCAGGRIAIMWSSRDASRGPLRTEQLVGVPSGLGGRRAGREIWDLIWHLTLWAGDHA